MYIKRIIQSHLKRLSEQFPAIAIMGPRQSGKTTLSRETFPEHTYVSLENLDTRKMAQEDPRGFLATYANRKGVIIDEIQEVPELFSYLQEILDQAYRPGYFILTGSQHFLLYEKITQSLAGRIALLTLLPLSVSELREAGMLGQDPESLLIKGFYPRLYAQNIDVQTWCDNYISTYVERDVRQVLKISDVMTFQRFLKLCAARVGNLLNYAELARDCDMSPNTAKAWLSILEASYIVKLLSPYHKNFNKRIIKTPKLYFYDTSLVCALLGIRTAHDLSLSTFRGAIFESYVISEILKYSYNNNERPQIYFWRDVQGHEIDCVIEKSFNEVVPVEIKARRTVSDDFFKGLLDWQSITDQPESISYVVYGGHENMTRRNGRIFGWNTIDEMLTQIYART